MHINININQVCTASFCDRVINGNDNLRSSEYSQNFIYSIIGSSLLPNVVLQSHTRTLTNSKKILIFIKLLYGRTVCDYAQYTHAQHKMMTSKQASFGQTNGHAKKPKMERIAANLMVTCINLFRVHINLHH